MRADPVLRPIASASRSGNCAWCCLALLRRWRAALGTGHGRASRGPQAKPVGAENLCHQAILMNHAADAVTSLNPDPIKVGDAVGESAQRRGLLQGSVRPVGVVATRGRTW
jgi:hypothetical protein